MVVNVVDELLGERFINSPPAGVRIDCAPYGFAGLLELRKHVPIIRNALHHRDGCGVETHFVFTGAPVPHRHGALAFVVYQIFPECILMIAR